MTHAAWNVKIKRALEMANRRPAASLRMLRTLMRAVESSLKKGLHEWHLAQTLHVISLVQAGAGDHRGSAKTLVRLTNEHESQLNYDARAYVCACAAAALQLAQDGDRAGATRLLQKAARWSALLRPRENLVDQARKTVAILRTRPRKRNSAG